jgi:hypothetical protein
MPRRFAVVLLLLLVLLLAALFGARALRSRVPPSVVPVPTVRPTPVVPPTAIPARRVTLYFEKPEDEKLHAEGRDVPASTDDIALLRAIASAVLQGPRHEALLKPFPPGWTLRSAFKLGSALAVLDLGVGADPSGAPEAASTSAGAPRWNAGSHEELAAVQALALSVSRSLPGIERIVILVNGEPVDTLGGHLDLTHPIHPDPSLASDEAPLPALPEPSPTPTPTVSPSPSPSAVPSPTSLPYKRSPKRQESTA